jgi:GTP cyclohydrolase I
MIDIQQEKDLRGIYINKVGIKAYVHPIKVKSLGCSPQDTVSNTNIYVDLEADIRAIHMSRLIEALNLNECVVDFSSVEKMLNDIISTMDSQCAQIELRFPYFIRKEAPISKKIGVVNYDCVIYASKQKDGKYHIEIQVAIPVCSVCPCSKAISDNGAHNQRGLMIVKCEANTNFSIESIIRCSEKAASAEIFALLKRVDEKHITESSYENAKFVEDIVRDAWLNLKQLTFIQPISISVENYESIHNHNAYAEIEYGGGIQND